MTRPKPPSLQDELIATIATLWAMADGKTPITHQAIRDCGRVRVPPRLLQKYALRCLPLVLPAKRVGFHSKPDFKPLEWAKIRRKGWLAFFLCIYGRRKSILLAVHISRK
jgi:hypothetical protein